jgi:FdrA protein
VSLAVISVPGPYAGFEAARALEAGLDVFCFSNGVSLAHEAILKRQAAERGVLFMGLDCGTALIDGVGVGFANAVRRGPVGIVGASGTGIQEVCCLLDSAGVGISHAIGVGGRDLSSSVGGVMFHRGLELLALDPMTEVIVAISKPPDAEVASAIGDRAASLGKPVILAFLELGAQTGARSDPVEHVGSLEAAAARAAELVGSPPGSERSMSFEHPAPPPGPGFVRGLFSGGTLCTEAMLIVAAVLSPVMSNIALRPEWRLPDVRASEGHTFIDFGADDLTEGRPHPMIDPALRLERLERELGDPSVGVILIDVVLGYGAHPDPAGALAPVIRSAPDRLVVAALCGTERDPQGLDVQQARLEEAGAIVTRSVAQAARVALAAVGSASPGGV